MWWSSRSRGPTRFIIATPIGVLGLKYLTGGATTRLDLLVPLSQFYCAISFDYAPLYDRISEKISQLKCHTSEIIATLCYLFVVCLLNRSRGDTGSPSEKSQKVLQGFKKLSIAIVILSVSLHGKNWHSLTEQPVLLSVGVYKIF